MDETKKELLDKANALPLTPGVYIMRDKNEKVIYVGKSKVLKNRVSQYFRGGRHDNKTEKMISCVRSFDYILTNTEIEALALENSLIKLHMPKYNILLKDSKNYPYIKVTINEQYPRVLFTRKRENDGAKYFGPYSGASPAVTIIKTVGRTFGLPQCSHRFPADIGKVRPCLYHQLGQCCAPCTGEVSSEEFREVIPDILSFLHGSFGEVKRSLTEKMNYASENLMFEAAARFRDRIAALDKLWERQKIVASPDRECDVFALYQDEYCTCVSVYLVRGGCVTDSSRFILPADAITEGDSMASFITEFYNLSEYIPRLIAVGFPLEGSEVLSQYLSEKAGYKVSVRIPSRGDLRGLCEMALSFATSEATRFREESERDNKTLVKLASMLSLEVVPERIEAYDISNYGAEGATAGKIYCEKGKFKKSGYRLYKIRESVSDDYSAMRECLRRRLSHPEDTYPDLILLDGGAGHVSVITELLSELGCDIPVFGMVKDEYHKTRAVVSAEEEISIAREQSVFMLIYRIQEEVHRFTHDSMTKSKRKTLRHSSLEEIEGIGAAKAKAVLLHFKTLQAVKDAGEDELCAVPGIGKKDAERIYGFFNNK